MTATSTKGKTVEIYGLFSPTGELRYIGKANNSKERFKGHMREISRRKTPVYCWIKSLVEKDQMPVMRVLDTVPESDWKRSEKSFIFEARLRGDRILNVADGGDEPHCPIEVRRANGRKVSQMLSTYPLWRQAIKQLCYGVKLAIEAGNEEKITRYQRGLEKIRSMTTAQKKEFNDKLKARREARNH